MGDVPKMECYLALLEEQSRESNHDFRWRQYVIYINTFLKRFGKEIVYLVGSTGDKTKLTFSKDDGDADFILVSGRYEVDVDQIEFNEYNACYLRIRADERSKAMGLETVDDKYVAANTLRDLKPELFTILRAIHTHVTATRYRLPEIGTEDTLISVPSKVGLASTRYRKLKLDDALLVRFKRDGRGNVRIDATPQAVIERWKDVPTRESDMKVLRRVFNVLYLVVNHGGESKEKSELEFTIGVMKDVMKRPFVAKMLNKVSADSVDFGMKEEASNKGSSDMDGQNAEMKGEDMNLIGMRNTYSEKDHKDYVPAMRLNGKLELMNRWKLRADTAGMSSNLVNEIYKEDIFVVSRVAPTHSNFETDFCLSFNIGEMKLVSNMTSMQRKVLLVMKAFLKGVFEIQHTKSSRSLKLKTYLIKHSLFWFFELNPEISFAEDTVENTMIVLRRATEFLKEKLENRMLPHYFVGSNLFSDFEDDDYRILKECIDTVLNDPLESLQCYFDLNDGKPCDIVFTAEEVECLLEMSKDGGRNKYLDRLEDALVDLQRGFNQGPRDDEMRAPIKEAILDIFRLFLTDEQVIDTKIFQQIDMFLTQGRTNSSVEVNAQIRTVADILNSMGIFVPDIKQFIEKFGGRPGLEQFLRGAFTGTPVDFSRDLDEQILEAIDRYLSCPDEEEADIAGELMYKLVGYFSGRKDYPRLSGLI